MPRRKRSSDTLERAERRMAGLRSIQHSLDLGNGLTLEAYFQVIETTRRKLAAYNTALSAIDQTYAEMLESEKSLSELTERMLLGVASKYGRNSNEYEMAGGSRRVRRRRSREKTAV